LSGKKRIKVTKRTGAFEEVAKNKNVLSLPS